MKIKACPICGSKNISMGGLGDGVLFGIDSWREVCRSCGYQGAPILFDSESEYIKFYNELNPKDKEKDKDQNSKKKRSQPLNKSDEKETRKRWKIFLISTILSIIFTLFFVPRILSLYDMPFSILGIIGQFIITLFTVFLLLLFIRFLFLGGKCK